MKLLLYKRCTSNLGQHGHYCHSEFQINVYNVRVSMSYCDALAASLLDLLKSEDSHA